MSNETQTLLYSITQIPSNLVEENRAAPECWLRLVSYLAGGYSSSSAFFGFISWILTQVASAILRA
jgi:hypothetical protein